MIAVTRWERHDAPRGRIEQLALDDLVTLLARPVPAAAKADLPGWAPTTFRGHYRKLENVETVYAAGIDVDGEANLDELLDAWSGIFAIIHTTASSTPGAPRWRIVVPFRTPLMNEPDARRAIVAAQRRTPGKIDTRTKDPSRLWYLPWAGAAHFEHAVVDGAELFDAHAAAEQERAREERPVRFALPPPTDGTYARRALARACNDVASAPDGARNNTLAREAWSIGQLVGAGVLAESEALGAFGAVIDRWGDPRKTRATLERQLRDGAKHPREIRRSPWG